MIIWKAWLIGWFISATVVGVLAMNDQSQLLHHQLQQTLCPMQLQHPLGCDTFGRDLLLVVLAGSSISLFFAGCTVVVSTLLAIFLGGFIAVSPGLLRSFLVRTVEFFLAFPSLLLALAWAAIRGPGWDTLLGALFIGIVPGFVRLCYLRALELLSEDYVTAARAMGAGNWHIIKKHLRPGLMDLAKVKFPNLFAHALLAEATLSFMGVGVPIGKDSWGALLAQGKDYLIEAPHIAMASGFPLVLTLIALQRLSERKRQSLN